MAGLVAVFVFAAQMLNFPVAAGTSGHLLGGALAAILIGPYTGVLAVSIVLMVQALLFADGGLTALGLNIVNMAFVTVLVAWPTFRLLAAQDSTQLGRGIVHRRLPVRACCCRGVHRRVCDRRCGNVLGEHRAGSHGEHARADRPRRGLDHSADRRGSPRGAT